jgi:hypothetical protein
MKLVCYFHEYTEADIIADLKRNKSDSSIMGQITEEYYAVRRRCKR